METCLIKDKIMTDKEILQKAINKAKLGGFRKKEPYYIEWDDICLLVGEVNPPDILRIENFHSLIFDHSFAKAFFGTKKDSIFEDLNKNCYYTDDESSACFYGPIWKFHLQQMVLEKEPLKYLEKFLDKGKLNV